jgi:hypothetical protein
MTRTRMRALLGLCLCLSACQPGTLCDPGQHAMTGGCYPDPMPAADSGEANEDDAGDTGDKSDAAPSCGGEPYQGFKASCSQSSECGCHAPDCATAPLNYCTKVNCDPGQPSECPPGWTCLMIPPGASPDPKLKTLCLAP